MLTLRVVRARHLQHAIRALEVWRRLDRLGVQVRSPSRCRQFQRLRILRHTDSPRPQRLQALLAQRRLLMDRLTHIGIPRLRQRIERRDRLTAAPLVDHICLPRHVRQVCHIAADILRIDLYIAAARAIWRRQRIRYAVVAEAAEILIRIHLAVQQIGLQLRAARLRDHLRCCWQQTHLATHAACDRRHILVDIVLVSRLQRTHRISGQQERPRHRIAGLQHIQRGRIRRRACDCLRNRRIHICLRYRLHRHAGRQYRVLNRRQLRRTSTGHGLRQHPELSARCAVAQVKRRRVITAQRRSLRIWCQRNR